MRARRPGLTMCCPPPFPLLSRARKSQSAEPAQRRAEALLKAEADHELPEEDLIAFLENAQDEEEVGKEEGEKEED